MKEKKAISFLAVFILQNKQEVISLINRLGISSLPQDASIDVVNEIVIDNPKALEEGLKSIANEGYSNVICAGVCVWIVAGIVVLVSGVAIENTIRNSKREREEIFRQGYTQRYLNKETLNEIAFINRKEMQKQFLIAQQDYLQQEENMIQENRLNKRNNIVYIILGGSLAVFIASRLLKK